MRVLHPKYLWFGITGFFICNIVLWKLVDRIRARQASEPILFSVHGYELQKLSDFAKNLPTPMRRLFRSLVLIGFTSLIAGFWLSLKGF